MLLGDLGADVIKVEGPLGDDTRTWQPPVHNGVSTYYLGVNRNKRSVILDLNEPQDQELARELISRCDVMIQNFRPGSLARFALDYDSARKLNPEIIYASITGFGADQGAAIPGYDLMVQAISGLMSLTGDPQGPPYRAGVAVFDVIAGLHSALGIVAALTARMAGSGGQHIEINLLSSALSGLVNQASAYVAGGTVPFRMGNSHPSLSPYEALPTADGDLVIACGNDGQFRKLCQVIGAPEIAADQRFTRNEDRTVNREALRPLLVQKLLERSKQDWFKDLITAGVPCGPINTIDQGIAFAEELGLDPVQTFTEGEDLINTIRNPIKFSQTPVQYRLAPPTLGEHDDEIRSWLIGARDVLPRT